MVDLKPGQTWYDGEDDGRCRVIRDDGTRCAASRIRATGACPGHSGVGAVAEDPAGMSRRAHAELAKRRQARATLGITARRASSPLQAARVAAQRRADDFARAVVDGPLDDVELGSRQRQQAAIAALELLYPQTSVSVSVDMPEDADGVRSLGWADLQALALSEGLIGGTTPVPQDVETA